MDSIPELQEFAKKLEKATLDTLEEGICTKDLADLYEGVTSHPVSTKNFLREIQKQLM